MSAGRPKIEINWDIVESMCAYFCTRDDIAGVLKCSVDTLERRIKETYEMTWTEYSDRHKSPGRVSIRRKQFEMAIRGSVPLLIWLGKNELGQSDKQSIEDMAKEERYWREPLSVDERRALVRIARKQS